MTGTGADWSDLWAPVGATIRLNHGSFGATPMAVAAAIAAHRHFVDEDRDHFFRRVRATEHEQARGAAAGFLGADLAGVALVANASAGITAVLRSFPFAEGDEILVTDHAYAAARLAVDEIAAVLRCRVVRAVIPLATDDATIVSTILDTVTPRTRLAMIDHITSATAEIWPVPQIVAALHAHDVAVLVDAAHAPGMVPIDLTALDTDFWVGNFHKWAFSGIAVAGLWVAEKWRSQMRPLIISHDNAAGYPESFGLQGTMDCSAISTLPGALALLQQRDWQSLAERNQKLAAEGIEVLASALDGSVISGGTRGSMTLLSVAEGAVGSAADALRLQQEFEDRLGVQLSVPWWQGRVFVRLSVQGYVQAEQIDSVASRLRTYRREVWGS